MFVIEKNKRNFWMLAVLLLALPLAVWSCRGNAGQTEENQTETTEEPATEQPGEQPANSEHPSDSEHPSEHPDNN